MERISLNNKRIIYEDINLELFDVFRLARVVDTSLTTVTSFLTRRVDPMKKTGNHCDRETKDRVHDKGRWNT